MTHDSSVYELASMSTPFNSIDDFAPLIDKIKDKRVVMLGESTYGTQEFYEWRRKITMTLIEEHGFNFIGIEGDWPACQEINRYIQHKSLMTPREALNSFDRWPNWIWGNEEMIKSMQWLYDWNREARKKVGIHGIDVYSLFESLDEILRQVGDVDESFAKRLHNYYGRLENFEHDESALVEALSGPSDTYENDLQDAFEEIQRENLRGPASFFEAAQNARVIKNGEKFIRSTILSGAYESWNIREQHMKESFDMLFDHYGPHSKGIFWGHNAHIGDYRGSNMMIHDQVNLGGLLREELGEENVALIGLMTNRGTVLASKGWVKTPERIELPEAKSGSIEAKLNEVFRCTGEEQYFVLLDDVLKSSVLQNYCSQRVIGVVYSPLQDEKKNYALSAIAKRYDALVYFEDTHALSPLEIPFDRKKIPDTYPFSIRN